MNNQKLYENFTVNSNGHYVNYNTNRPIFAYKGLFLVMSADIETILKILYPTDLPISYVRTECSKIQQLQNKTKMINGLIHLPKIEKSGVESFHQDIGSLHPDTKEGAVFIDAYNTHIGIFEILNNHVKIITNDGILNEPLRKDVLGLLQRINQHKFIGISNAYKDYMINSNKNKITEQSQFIPKTIKDSIIIEDSIKENIENSTANVDLNN